MAIRPSGLTPGRMSVYHPNRVVLVVPLLIVFSMADTRPSQLRSPNQLRGPPFFKVGTVFPISTMAHSHLVLPFGELIRDTERLVAAWNSPSRKRHFADHPWLERFVLRKVHRVNFALDNLRLGAMALAAPLPGDGVGWNFVPHDSSPLNSPDSDPADRFNPAPDLTDNGIRIKRQLGGPGVNLNVDIGKSVKYLFSGLRSLFGLADKDDVKAAQAHLVQRTDLLAGDLLKLHRWMDRLHTSLHWDLLQAKNRSNELFKEQHMMKHGLRIADVFDQVARRCEQISRAMQFLATGQLTTDLVPVQQANIVMTSLTRKAADSGLTLGLRSALNFYLADVSVTVSKEEIDVLASFPAYDAKQEFQLYEFSPIPLLPDPVDPLWLVETGHWLAVADGLPSERETAVWTRQEFKDNCREFEHNEWFCVKSFIVKEAASSCLPSLFLGLDSTATSCDFHRVVNSSGLYGFTHTGLLVTFSPAPTPLQVSCSGHNSYLTLDGLTSFAPPAGCTLATPVWSLPSLPVMPSEPPMVIPVVEAEDLDVWSYENVTVLEDQTLHVSLLPALDPPAEMPPMPVATRAIPWVALGLAALAVLVVCGIFLYLWYILQKGQQQPPAPEDGGDEKGDNGEKGDNETEHRLLDTH